MGKKTSTQVSEATSSEELSQTDIGIVDGKWAWVVCFSGFMCNVISFGIFMTFGIFLEPLMKHYNASNSSVSLVGSFMSGTFMMSMAITSVFVNQYGCRIVGTIGGVVTAISLGLSSICPNITTLVLCYGVLCGFGFGMVYMPLIVSCGHHFKKRLALAQGIMAVGASIGCMVFPPLANYIISQHDWQTCLRIFAVLHMVCAVFSLTYRPLPTTQQDDGSLSKIHSCNNIYIVQQLEQCHGNNTNANKVQRASINATVLKSNERTITDAEFGETIKWLLTTSVSFIKESMFKSPLRRPEFALLCIANFFGDFTQYLPYIYLPGMMGTVQGITASDASFSIAIMGFSNMVGRIVSGVVLDLPFVNSFAFIFLSFVSSGLCVILFPFCFNYTTYLVVEIFYGLCVASYIVAIPTLLIDMFGINVLATTFGLLQLFRGLGCLIGPIVCGLMYDHTKSYVTPFVTAGLMFIFGGVLTGFVWTIKRKQLRKPKLEKIFEDIGTTVVA